MIENQKTYDFFYKVLNKLQEEQILQDFILVGSWCLFYYKDLFQSESFSILRTRDVDFLLKTPPNLKNSVDIPKILDEMGFIMDLHKDGFMKFGNPELGLDFLVAQKGGYANKPYRVEKLKIAAQPLPFMQLLLVDTIKVQKDNLTLTLPHPIRFSFHKLLISKRRMNKEKQSKDRKQANEVLECCIKYYEEQIFKNTWNSFLPKWQKSILEFIENENLVELLQNN